MIKVTWKATFVAEPNRVHRVTTTFTGFDLEDISRQIKDYVEATEESRDLKLEENAIVSIKNLN